MIDDSERHEIYLARLTTRLLNARVYPSLEEAYKAARRILLDAEEIGSIRVMQRLQKEVGDAVADELQKGWDGATEDLNELAVYEAGYAAKLTGGEIAATLSVPAANKIESFIASSVMTLSSGRRVDAGKWADYVAGAVDSAVRQYNGIIANGYQNGQTVNQIAKQLRDSTNGLLRSQAEALARTGQSHFANMAREAMALDNLKDIKYRVFVATFDNRTTLQCRALDGKSWAMDDDKYPRLPLHFNERSVYVYTNDPKKVKTGKRAAVGGKSVPVDPDRELRYRGKKDTDIFKPGQVSAGESMDSWLRSQPDWFIEDSLGPVRAKLFKDGGLKIDKFADLTGRPLTIEQLLEIDAEAFKRAGIK